MDFIPRFIVYRARCANSGGVVVLKGYSRETLTVQVCMPLFFVLPPVGLSQVCMPLFVLPSLVWLRYVRLCFLSFPLWIWLELHIVKGRVMHAMMTWQGRTT